MKNILNIFAVVLLLTGAMFISGDSGSVSAQTGNDLVSQLPASDAVATINLKKLLNEVVPQFLSSQPAKLAELNAKIDDIKAKTGIDIRQFEQAAIGVNLKQIKAGGAVETEPIVLMRGSFNAAGLISVGKIAANGKFRQEQIGGKTVSIFTLPENAKDAAKQADASGEMSTKIDQTLNGEFAVYVIDNNTLAIGKLLHIRSVLTDKRVNNRVAANLTEMVNRNPGAVMNFAGNIPLGMSASYGLGNDQIGKIVDSLRQMFGSLDANNGAISFLLGARTAEEPQAQELENSLLGLQMLGKGMIGSKSDEKSQIASRVIENLKITRAASEVQMQASVTSSDINKLISPPAAPATPLSNQTQP